MITALIERAVLADQPAVFRLLEENHLPVAGLEQHFVTALVARDAGRVVGSAALEVYADGALLRSVAVAPGLRRNGIGHQLTEAALQLAQQFHFPAAYLLTNTAPAFFPKFGFESIARADVPATVQQSIEFR
jgi:N-acetylglutamate synthase-like GNAT family acetyltransferase